MGAVMVGTIVALDQATKWLVDHGMALHQSIPVIPGFLSLTYVRNTGAAFGMLASPSPGLRSLFLLLFSGLAIGLILWLWIRERQGGALYRSALALVLGGALGNLIDRIRLGEVIDFVDVYWRNYHWPAFNVADSAITAGVALLLIHLLIQPRTRPTA
jgi:signal peptidase II